jgi:hypothetical protein
LVRSSFSSNGRPQSMYDSIIPPDPCLRITPL